MSKLDTALATIKANRAATRALEIALGMVKGQLESAMERLEKAARDDLRAAESEILEAQRKLKGQQHNEPERQTRIDPGEIRDKVFGTHQPLPGTPAPPLRSDELGASLPESGRGSE